MSASSLKSSELQQAQLATYAAERVEHYGDSRHIFDNIGALALRSAGDITRLTASAEYHKDESGNRMKVPEGTERTVVSSGEYTDFLRSVGGSRYEAIEGRADMLKAYGRFEPAINRLKSELIDPAVRTKHENFLGNGSNSTALWVEEAGKKYAVRVPNGPRVKSDVIDAHLAGAVLSKGLPHVEQMVAASYKDGVTVAEIMPGRETGKLTLDDIAMITDGQLHELVGTLVEINRRGIEIDPKPSNIFYDSEAGYGIVDVSSSKIAGKNSADQETGEIVGWMATAIGDAGLYGKPYNPDKTVEEYAHDLEFMKANLEVLQRFRAVVETALSGQEQEKALAKIDRSIVTMSEAVDNYSDPRWVSQHRAEAQERKRQREESLSRSKSGTGWDLV